MGCCQARKWVVLLRLFVRPFRVAGLVAQARSASGEWATGRSSENCAVLLRPNGSRSSPPPYAADCNPRKLGRVPAGGEQLKRDEWAEFLRLVESRGPEPPPA